MPRNGLAVDVRFPPPGLPRPLRGLAMTRCGVEECCADLRVRAAGKVVAVRLRTQHPDEVIARTAQPAVAIQVRQYTPLHARVRSGGATTPVPRNGIAVEVAVPQPESPRPLRGLAMTRCGVEECCADLRERAAGKVVAVRLRTQHPDEVIARPAQPAVAIQVRQYTPLHGDRHSCGATAPAPRSGVAAEVEFPPPGLPRPLRGLAMTLRWTVERVAQTGVSGRGVALGVGTGCRQPPAARD